jgi:hypothetical protein
MQVTKHRGQTERQTLSFSLPFSPAIRRESFRFTLLILRFGERESEKLLVTLPCSRWNIIRGK